MPRSKKNSTRKSNRRKTVTTRTKAGRPRGGQGGSKSDRIRTLLRSGMAPMAIAKKVGSTPALVYNVKSRLAGGGGKAPKRRGPGRPRTTAAGFDGLSDVVAAVRKTERDQADLRKALEKIQEVIQSALA